MHPAQLVSQFLHLGVCHSIGLGGSPVWDLRLSHRAVMPGGVVRMVMSSSPEDACFCLICQRL